MKPDCQFLVIIQDLNPNGRFNDPEYDHKLRESLDKDRNNIELLIIPPYTDPISFIEEVWKTYNIKKIEKVFVVTSPTIPTIWKGKHGKEPDFEKIRLSVDVCRDLKAQLRSEKLIWIIRDRVVSPTEGDPTQGYEYVDFFVNEPNSIERPTPLKLFNMLRNEEFVQLVVELMEPEKPLRFS